MAIDITLNVHLVSLTCTFRISGWDPYTSPNPTLFLILSNWSFDIPLWHSFSLQVHSPHPGIRSCCCFVTSSRSSSIHLTQTLHYQRCPISLCKLLGVMFAVLMAGSLDVPIGSQHSDIPERQQHFFPHSLYTYCCSLILSRAGSGEVDMAMEYRILLPSRIPCSWIHAASSQFF